jgi:hypothetical protein
MLSPFPPNQKIPWMEDVCLYYIQSIWGKLFPPDTENKPFVYLVGALHLLGATVLQYGVWVLPGKYFYLYFIYVTLHILSWIIFRGNCFMTLLTNYFGKNRGTSLHIRSKTAFNSLIGNVIICIIGMINHDYAPINFLSRL